MRPLRTRSYYLPWSRALRRRMKLLYGGDGKYARDRVCALLTVGYQTLATWMVGNSIPGSIEKRLAVGVFMGWMKDGEDKEGIKKTLRYFNSEECRSTEEERTMHLRRIEVKQALMDMRRHRRQQRKKRGE